MIVSVVLFVYGLALALVGCYSCRAQKAKSKKTENRQFRKEQAVKMMMCLRDIRNVPEENEKLRKSEIKKATQKMPLKIRLHLIAVADRLPTVGQYTTLLKPVVQAVIPEGEKSQKLLAGVKSLPISNGLKNKIFSTQAQGAVTRVKSSILDKVPYKVKNELSVGLSIISEIFNLFTMAMQDVKDLGVIATMFFFYNEVLQQRSWLIDGINLNDYVTLLAGIYFYTLLLRLLGRSNTLNKEENEEINVCVRMMPFFNELYLCFKIIKGTVNVFKMKRSIATSLENKSEEEEETWEDILRTSEKITRAEVKLEKRKRARMRIKLCALLGDVLQACVLSILLLRSDLRVRGALVNVKQTNFMGGRPDEENVRTQGRTF